MAYESIAAMLPDLQRQGQLLIFDEPIRAEQEISAVLRRLYQAQGPAVLFQRVEGTPFPVVGNLYGTVERARFLLRHGLRRVEKAMRLKAQPQDLLRRPWRYLDLPLSLPHLLPRRVRRAPVLQHRCKLSELPRHVSWPGDGGPFVTLPAVYSQPPGSRGLAGWLTSNLGMYRIQLAGNDYLPEREVGLHYQIHRGIGIHHQQAVEQAQPLWVNVLVGGPPALAWAAVMPLPEGLPEVVFAAALAGRPLGWCHCPQSPLPIVAEADFCIVGRVDPEHLKPEGPFGDHLGYYSLVHPFPVLQVEAVYHRPGAIWPVTTVGRPPQEDTTFGALIHELTAPVLPTVLPGVKQVHAVDAAGVHPLLLALASERYTPYQQRKRPQEVLTCAHAILGQGQLSLAKYLLIGAQEDNPGLDCHDTRAFFHHLLERIDWRRDLHFHTRTTIDTLDYSGEALNQGSKVVMAAVGGALRTLPSERFDAVAPPGVLDARLVAPGILALQAPSQNLDAWEELPLDHPWCAFPLWVVVDDARRVASSWNEFLWTTFTRSNPAADIYGVHSNQVKKHWGCKGSLIIDARSKPHHAPALEEDPEVVARVQAWACRGGPLHGKI